MQKIKRPRLTRSVCHVFGVLWLASMMIPAAALAQNPPFDASVGDVFVGVQAVPLHGTSSAPVYEVWHNNGTAARPSFSLMQTVVGTGTPAGCAFDSAYRLFGTDSHNADVLRFAIDNADDTPFPNIIVRNVPSSGFNTTNSVAFDGNAVHSAVDGSKLYVGYANGGLDMFTVSPQNNYVKNASFSTVQYPTKTPGSITVENGGVKWLDVAADGHTIVYTSNGRKIFTFDTTAQNKVGLNIIVGGPSVLYADLSTVNNTGSGPLGAIRIPSPGDGSTGVLVADQGDVKLVQAGTFASANGTGAISNIVKFTKFPAQDSTLQSLSLDPTNPLTIVGTSVTSGRFWAGDANTNDVIWYDAGTNKTVTHFTAGNTGTLGGLCVDGSFSPAQLAFNPIQSPTSSDAKCTTAAPANGLTCNLTPPTNNSPNSNTATFTSPYSGQALTITLTDLANPVALTLRDSLVDTSVALSDPTVYSFVPNSNGVPLFNGLLTGNLPCYVPASLNPGLFPGCEVFEFEANPNSGYSAGNLLICPPGGGCTFPVDPNTGNLPQVRGLKNEDADYTTGLDGIGTKTKCVTTINVQTPNDAICSPATDTTAMSFSSPAGGTSFSKNQNSTISFKFQIGQFSSGTCNANTSPPLCPTTGLCVNPLLVISETSTGGAPAPLFTCTSANPTQCIDVAGSSSQSFLPPTFVLSGNTWQLQIKTSTLNLGQYLATMIDLNSVIPTFSVQFTIGK